MPAVRPLVETFLAWVSKHRRPRTEEHYGRYLRSWMAQLQTDSWEDLTPLHLMDWARTWHQTQAVKRFAAWVVHVAEASNRNPFGKVPLPPAGLRQRVLDERGLAQVLRAARRPFREFLLAMRETFARPQEIREVQWEEVWHPDERGMDLRAALVAGRGFFVLSDYKARERRKNPHAQRVIPITKRLGRLLVRRLDRLDGPPAGKIFANTQGRPWTANAVRCAMRLLRRRQGIAVDHRGESLVAYTLRHTMATQATQRGVRDRLLADLLGHTSTRTTARYQHLDRKDLAEAVAKVRRGSGAYAFQSAG